LEFGDLDVGDRPVVIGFTQALDADPDGEFLRPVPQRVHILGVAGGDRGVNRGVPVVVEDDEVTALDLDARQLTRRDLRAAERATECVYPVLAGTRTGARYCGLEEAWTQTRQRRRVWAELVAHQLDL
jgi:hypothetical protein